ncbi:energy transducer TonB [Erythrobacter sp. BLCC-B19]|uniref:energy transducer TonB n=1 Tax=Erythrobacter sp. BLCC-B19 TaxID=3025315 RepID=UPI00235E3DDB|nr:energy transducer TonB [Erythrobacter sp. BLCC-B19]WDA41751.1 energy transducer TonB [Erythrobacter sp. BLCC-B19]
MRRFSPALALIALAAPAALWAQSVPMPLEPEPARPMLYGPSTPAPPTNNPIIWREGQWDLFAAQKLKFCALRLRDKASGVVFGVMQSGRGPVRLRVTPSDRDVMYAAVTLRAGKTAFAAPLTLEGTTAHYWATGTAAEVLGPLAKAEVVTVEHDGRLLARFVLDGTREALAKLADCAAQWPDEQLFSPVPAHPARPAIPEPDLAGPFEPWQRPRALGQEHWILPEDYPRASMREDEQGRVVVLVEVSAEGRATSCKVRQSSGFVRLDQATCAAMLIRARFQPATDLIGQPQAATMAFPVNWKFPEIPESKIVLVPGASP